VNNDNVPLLTLTTEQIQSLARGFGDLESLQVLREGQHSRTLQALASILELAPTHTTADAITLLDAAQAHDEPAMFEAFSYPCIAEWAQVCLEQLLGITDEDGSHRHILHIARIAAAVAHQCGLDFEIMTEVERGGVSLPGLGFATLDATDGTPATIRNSGGRLSIAVGSRVIEINGDGPAAQPHWQAVRHVYVDSGGLTLQLALDDLDPYRDRYPGAALSPPAHRLDEIGFKAWSENLWDAWAYIVHEHRALAEDILHGLRVIVPITEDRFQRHDRSVNSFGAIATTNISPQWLAYAMLEEFQRSKVTALNYLFPLHRSTFEEKGFFGIWFHLPLSFRQFFESTHAAPVVAGFWAEQARRTESAEDRIRAALLSTLWTNRLDNLKARLARSGELTELGHEFVKAIPSPRNIPTADTVDPKLLAFSRATEADSRLGWRLQNLEVAPSAVEQLTIAWISAEPCPLTINLSTTLVHDSSATMDGWRTRRKLGIRRLADPDMTPEVARLIEPEATSIDLLIAYGNFDDAWQEALDNLASRPADKDVWNALAITSVCRQNTASVSLGRYPEIVFAVYNALDHNTMASTDVEELAFWLMPRLLRDVDDACT
jgi:HEXXH motif-containing protein